MVATCNGIRYQTLAKTLGHRGLAARREVTNSQESPAKWRRLGRQAQQRGIGNSGTLV